MNTAGWLLTESGRQPWIVQGLMKTADGVSPSVTTTDIWISLVAFVLIYLVLGAVDGYLMVHYGRKSLEGGSDDDTEGDAQGSGGTGSAPGEGRPDSRQESERAEFPALVY